MTLAHVPGLRREGTRSADISFDSWLALGQPRAGTRLIVETPEGDCVLGELVLGRTIHVRLDTSFDGFVCIVRFPLVRR